jgi:signal transduction histidine kinase
MSPDWSEMYHLDGKDFIPDTNSPTREWVRTYIDTEDQARVLSVVQDAIRNKSVFQLEHRVIRTDGSTGWVLSRAVPLLDEHGEVVEWFGAARDVSARKQMEVDLREAHSKLEMRVRQRTEELEQVQGDLRDVSAKLLQLQDEERRRIARDLHDSAGQTLTVLGMNLGQLEEFAQSGNGQFTEKLQEAQELLQRVTREIRTTSYLLHPPLLDESGIAAALRWYVDGLMQRTPLKIDLSISEDFGRLPRETELAMFRIVQESLSNVLRHSGSDVAKIRVNRHDSRVTPRSRRSRPRNRTRKSRRDQPRRIRSWRARHARPCAPSEWRNETRIDWLGNDSFHLTPGSRIRGGRG